MPIFNNAKNVRFGTNQVKGVRRGQGLIFAPFNSATGGNSVVDITNYNGTGETWRVHSFTSNGTFTVQSSFENYRVLVVGGGGGGNTNTYNGGGGGGGGLYYNANQSISPGSYPVTVGIGGPKGGPNSQQYTPSDPTYRGDGRPSTFLSYNAPGGGGAGTYASAGRNGACGGGGSSAYNQPGGTGSMGGNGVSSEPAGNGSGGAGGGMGPTGGSSGNGSGNTGGPGRIINITGSSVEYCRGGHGGGKGQGSVAPPPNTGQGGNGNGGAVSAQTGSSGVVIVAYRIG